MKFLANYVEKGFMNRWFFDIADGIPHHKLHLPVSNQPHASSDDRTPAFSPIDRELSNFYHTKLR
jgi:hypothetical protein